MIENILAYGHDNPLYSLIVVGIFIFVITIMFLSTKADLNKKLSEAKYYDGGRISDQITECNQMFGAAIVFATIPVYFLWLPMLMVLAPMVLAYIVLNHRKFLTMFTTKKVVDNG